MDSSKLKRVFWRRLKRGIQRILEVTKSYDGVQIVLTILLNEF